MAINMEGANSKYTRADVARSWRQLADSIRQHKNAAPANRVMERNSYEPASTKSDLGLYKSTPPSNKVMERNSYDPAPVSTKANTGPYMASPNGANTPRDRMENATNEYQAYKAEAEKKQEEEAKAKAEAEAAAASEPNIEEIFNEYSDKHLDGMGTYDFVVVDPYSTEDRQMWRDWVYSDEAADFYKDVLAEYDNDFDAYYDAMTGLTLTDVLSDPDAILDYMPSNEWVGTFLDEVAYRGYIPDISGDEGQQAKIESFLDANPYASSLQMRYILGHNLAASLANDVLAGEMTPEEAQEILSLDEYNYLMELGNARFGYGDDYKDIKDYDGGEFDIITKIDPNAYEESQEKHYTSYPGTGLADYGDVRALANVIYGDDVGWIDNPDVDSSGVSASDWWAAYDSGSNPVGWNYNYG